MSRPVHFPAATRLALACLAGVLTACASNAQRPLIEQQHAPMVERFHAADSNADEQLDAAEFAAGFAESGLDFSAMDTDHNAVVSLAELLNYLEWRRIAREPMPRPGDPAQHQYR